MEKEIIEYIYFFSKKIVVYLHGGPDFSIKNEDDDPFVKYLLKNKINVVIVNYPLVSGEGGTTDLKFVRCKIFAVIEKYSEYILYVLGDSYGGYLASLLTDISRIKEVIVVSGFISLRYQYLFSTERSWLKEYMDKGATDFLRSFKKRELTRQYCLFKVPQTKLHR